MVESDEKRKIKRSKNPFLCGAMIRSQLTYDFTHDHRIKLLVCGDSSVGKTSLLTRFVSDKFNVRRNRTVGVDIMLKNVVIQEKKIQLKLWDTAGSGCDSIDKLHFRKVHGILLVYDVTDQNSFDSLPKWLKHLKKVVAHSKVPVMLLGNKADLKDKRKIDTDEGARFAQKHNMPFFETSCLTTTNVSEAFHGLVEKILEEQSDFADDSIDLTDSEPVSLLEPKTKKKCCCR